ncbi:Mitochondrial matrix cochaperone [Loxospora ochrophaea]|nr:Mitochondrial matrix cochaperone [Loxospora ochrophaea]
MIQRLMLRQSRATSSNLSRSLAHPSPRSFPHIQSISTPSIHRAFTPRPYSSTAEEKTPPRTDSSPSEPPLSKQEAEDPAKKELEAKNKEILDLKDRYLRSVADFRNLQDRTARDVSSARDFAISRFAKDLLDSIDNLDRALGTVPSSSVEKTPENESNNKDLMNLYGGLKMTEQILMSTLAKHGIERFDPTEKGEKFDPNLHEATFMTKMEGKDDGTAFHTQQKGFLLNGRVIRAAKVGVVKNS